jgi:peptide/nickel transport system permease protein
MNKEFIKIILKRILSSLVVLFLLISFLFVLIRLSPGSPSEKYISPKLSSGLVKKIQESYSPENSIIIFYKNFVVNLVEGNLGISYNYRMPVTSVISNYLPFTVCFALTSFIIQIIFSFWLALIAVRNKNGGTDKFISYTSLVVYSIPSFVIGVMLIFFFTGLFKVFPSSGLKSFDFDTYTLWGKFLDYAEHLILPLITLSASGIAVFYRYLRENLEDVYNQTFVTNLRSYGVSEREITFRHIIPNAVSPVISIAGVELGFLLSGTLITEVIFGLPGMGRLTIDAIFSRDYPLVIGCSFVVAVLVIASNFLADLIKALIDKRVLKEILN